MPIQVNSLNQGSFTLTGQNRTTGASWLANEGHRLTTASSYDRKDPSSSPLEPNGWRKPSPYLRIYNSVVEPYGTLRWRDGNTDYAYVGTHSTGATFVPVPDLNPGLRTKAEIGALLKLKSQKVNLGVAFGERAATAELVGNTASKLAKAYRQTRKGNLKGAARTLGAEWRGQPRNWLELQYGWKPLLQDVYGAAESLKGTLREDWKVTVKGQASEKGFDPLTRINGMATWSGVVKWSRGYFVRLDYLPENPFLASLSSLGLTNPAVIAWELVPFSFVVDWMIPIGDWLNSLDAALGYEFYSGSFSEFRTASVVWEPTKLVHSKSFFVYENSLGGGRSREIVLYREPYRRSPLPSFPGVKNPVSLGHMANGLSLLAQAFRR